MHNIRIYILLITISLICGVGCNRTKPQSPSNRYSLSHQDTTSIALVLINQQLAQEADKEIMNYVKEHGTEQYVLDASGYWARKILKTGNQKIQKGDELDLRIVLFSVDGTMLSDSRGVKKVTDAEMLLPVLEMLQLMNIGEQAELIVPWYAAYGSTGCREVPPYTNLRIEIISY